MALVDKWHGYYRFMDITMIRDNVHSDEASNARIIGEGDNRLTYQVSPFAPKVSCDLKGDNWRRELTPVVTKQAVYVPTDLCERIFDLLVGSKLAKVSEWSNFHFCLQMKHNCCRFVDINCKNTLDINTIRFHHPEWRIQPLANKLRTGTNRRILNLNYKLEALKRVWQDTGNPDASGWMKWEPELFGVPQ